MPPGREQQASAEHDHVSDASSGSGYDSDDARLREVRACTGAVLQKERR
jgi:hypothetical protein